MTRDKLRLSAGWSALELANTHHVRVYHRRTCRLQASPLCIDVRFEVYSVRLLSKTSLCGSRSKFGNWTTMSCASIAEVSLNVKTTKPRLLSTIFGMFVYSRGSQLIWKIFLSTNFMTLIPSLTFTELWVVSMEHLQRVWLASRERLPFRTPCSVPLFGTCLCSNCWDQIPPVCHVSTRLFTLNTLGTFPMLLISHHVIK